MAEPESTARLTSAWRELDRWVASGAVPGVSAAVIHRGGPPALHEAGQARWSGQTAAVRPDTMFLLASTTKPYTAAATMLLIQDGRLALDDRLVDLLPEWRSVKGEIALVQVRHLLTHTSGLADSVSNPILRANQAPLSEFVKLGLTTGLEAEPGQRFSYSSMNLVVQGEIVHRITGTTLADFLAERVFQPSGLRSTFLGAPESVFDRIAEIRLWSNDVPGHMGDRPSPYDYNSAWFRKLATPWTGVYAPAEEVARFGQLFIDGLHGRPDALFSRATVELMTRVHSAGIPGTAYGVGEQWALGWAVRGAGRPFFFGDLASPDTFGHIGYTGTALWVDPRREIVCAILTNTVTTWAEEHRRFGLVANIVQAALS